MSNQYARVRNDTQEVIAWFLQPEPPLDANEAYRYERIEPHFSYGTSQPPSPTSRLYHRGGEAVQWEETAPLQFIKLRASEEVDSIGEGARLLVISKQTQTKEYERAEQHAREYRNAGYAGTPGRGVTSWTKAKWRDGWTDKDSADDILATADKWYNLLDDIREARLGVKQDILHSTTAAEIESLLLAFKSVIVDTLGSAQ